MDTFFKDGGSIYFPLLLSHESRSPVHHPPTQPALGLIPPSPHKKRPDLAMATMSRVAEAVHPADAFLGVPPQSGGLGCGSGNPSVSFGLRTTPDPKSPGSYTPPPRPILYLEDLRQPAVPLPAPEPPVPSG